MHTELFGASGKASPSIKVDKTVVGTRNGTVIRIEDDYDEKETCVIVEQECVYSELWTS